MSVEDREPSGQSRILAGLIIIVIGLSLLADRVVDWDVRFTSHMWPFILIAIGVVRAVDGAYGADGRRRRRMPGLWLIYLGSWGVINEFHVFGFNYGTSWPLLVVGAGLMIVGRAMNPHSACVPSGRRTDRERATAAIPEQQEHRS
jgi:LiaF transmembrane domain